MTTPSTPHRTRRIRRDGTEVRQVVEFALEQMVDQSRRTTEALLAAGYAEADVNRLILEWWEQSAAHELRSLAFDLSYALGLAKARAILEQAVEAEDKR